jgi:hypothetical protein
MKEFSTGCSKTSPVLCRGVFLNVGGATFAFLNCYTILALAFGAFKLRHADVSNGTLPTTLTFVPDGTVFIFQLPKCGVGMATRIH